MTEQEAKTRFARARVARLATVDAGNSPHLVPICFALDEAASTLYSAVDAKPKTTTDLKRLRNITANPQVTVLVDHYEDDWEKVWWVRMDGTATLADDDGPDRQRGIEALAEKYEQYRGAGPGQANPLGRIVVVEATNWRSWAYAEFG